MTECKTMRGGGRPITSVVVNEFERLRIVLQNFIRLKRIIAIKKLLFQGEDCNKSCHTEITLDCFKLLMLISNDFKIIVDSLKNTLAEPIANQIYGQLLILGRIIPDILNFEDNEDFNEENRNDLEAAYLNAFTIIVTIQPLLLNLINLIDQHSSIFSRLTPETITEALKRVMIDSLNANLRLLTEVTFDTIAGSVEPFLESYLDILALFHNRIRREREDDPIRISRQQAQLRERRDARAHATEQGRRFSPPVGFPDETDEFEPPPFEHPETDDLDREYALNYPEEGRGRGRKSRKRKNSTRMFKKHKKHKKQKKQILTTRKRNKRRTSTRRR